jgi:hypothetical protein
MSTARLICCGVRLGGESASTVEDSCRHVLKTMKNYNIQSVTGNAVSVHENAMSIYSPYMRK